MIGTIEAPRRYIPRPKIYEEPVSSESNWQWEYPELIQGGMGVAISGYELANAVAKAAEKYHVRALGVVSGTGLTHVMVDRLQNGSQETKKEVIEALKAFNPQIAEEIIEEYGFEGCDKIPPKLEKLVNGGSKIKEKMTRMSIAAGFVEIYLAKKGHSQPIGINILTKIEASHLPTLLGAMLAGVDYVLAGAGLPNQIPEILNKFSEGQTASYKLSVANLPKGSEGVILTLDPSVYIPKGTKLKRPKFYAIFGSDSLVKRFGRIADGVVIERPGAGGHNMSPRGGEIDEEGNPKYNDKDEPDYEAIAKVCRKLRIPFFVAGGWAGRLMEAKKLGAGIQVGTAFAVCDESGMDPVIAEELRHAALAKTLKVKARNISPTGYPLETGLLDDTQSDKKTYDKTPRNCTRGYLATPVFVLGKHTSKIIYRCPAEPLKAFIAKGGKEKDAEDQRCVCNNLLCTASSHAPRKGKLITLGEDTDSIVTHMRNSPDGNHYSAEDVVVANTTPIKRKKEFTVFARAKRSWPSQINRKIV